MLDVESSRKKYSK